mgnify:FL=1
MHRTIEFRDRFKQSLRTYELSVSKHSAVKKGVISIFGIPVKSRMRNKSVANLQSLQQDMKASPSPQKYLGTDDIMTKA